MYLVLHLHKYLVMLIMVMVHKYCSWVIRFNWSPPLSSYIIFLVSQRLDSRRRELSASAQITQVMCSKYVVSSLVRGHTQQHRTRLSLRAISVVYIGLGAI